MGGPTATYVNGEDKDTQYKLAFLYKLCIVLLVVGALNWLFTGVFGMNFVKIIFGEGWLAKTVYVLVGLAALYVMFDRNTYLPFLGPMVAPCAGLVDRVPPGANAGVEVHVKPGAKVLYWAAEQPNGDALMSVIQVKNVNLTYRVLKNRTGSVKELFRDAVKGRVRILDYVALEDISFSVNKGGKLKKFVQYPIIIKSKETDILQVAEIAIGQIYCSVLENFFINNEKN
jgi:uncharacterized membrane protein YuzA (DUF378 family)